MWWSEGAADLLAAIRAHFVIHLALSYLFQMHAVISYLFDFYLVIATDTLRGPFHL